LINGTTVAEMAQWTNTAPVTLSEFVAVGPLRPTEAGLAFCLTDAYAKAVDKITKTKTEGVRFNPEDVANEIFVYTTLRICADSAGEVAAEEADIYGFVCLNQHLLARLSLPAGLVNYPGVVRHMQQHRTGDEAND
jgi:hypothetical protein